MKLALRTTLIVSLIKALCVLSLKIHMSEPHLQPKKKCLHLQLAPANKSQNTTATLSWSVGTAQVRQLTMIAGCARNPATVCYVQVERIVMVHTMTTTAKNMTTRTAMETSQPESSLPSSEAWQ